MAAPAHHSPQPERKPIIRIWGHRNFSIYMAGSVPMTVTQWMQRVGVGWMTWELTHSAAWLGVVAAADLAPMLVLGPLGGALSDRADQIRMLRITQFLMVAQAVALAALAYAGLVNIWVLFLASLATGVIAPFFGASRQSVLPNTIPRSELSTAIALDSALFQATRFVGPAIASLMIPVYGVEGTFIAYAVGSFTFLASVFLIDVTMPQRAPRANRNILQDIGESLTYVRSHRGIWPAFLLLATASIFVRPVQDMLPGFAGDVFKSDAVGLAYLTSSMGIGAMLSAGFVAYRGRINGLTRHAVFGTIGLALSILGFVLSDILWFGVLFSALIGFMLNTMSTSISALVQTAVHDSMRGRVISLYALVFRGMPAVGTLVVGILSGIIGLRWTFVGSAAIMLIAWLLVLPRRRDMTAALEVEK
jgi:MFS family permease